MPLLYRIEFRESLLAVRIEEQGSRRILYRDTLKALAKEEDREALSFLTKLHLRSPNASRSADTISFQQIELPPEQTLEALRLLSKTGKLYYKNDLLRCEGPAKIYWKGEKHSEKACTLEAVLQWQMKEVPLKECEKAFPSWCLLSGVIFPIENKVPWRWVEMFVRGPLLLEGVQKKRFLEEDPPILWKALPPETPFEVFPQLVLSDPTGCFSNLWMNYGEAGRVAFEDLAPSVGGKPRLKQSESSWEKDLLEAGYQRKIVGQSRYYCPGDKVLQTLSFLLELGWTLFDPRGRRILRQTAIEWDLREERGALAVRGNVAFQEKSAPLKKAVQTRGLFLEIDGSSVGLVDRKGFEVLEGEWEGETLLAKKASLPALAPLLEEGKVQWEEGLKRMAEGFRQGASLETSPPGEGFRGHLLPYQQKGVDWLSFLERWGFSALLADEMGLGKTVQVLAFFSRLGTNLPILVIAPSSLLYNWRSELERFLPGFKVSLYAGADRIGRFEGIVITSYAILRLDEEILAATQFGAIVLDESNAIKTSGTQTARAACRLKGRFKIALSGTPIENRPEELWSQFRFLMPELFGELSDFQAAGFQSHRRKIKPFLLRRRKQEVEIELPEKIEQIAWVEMSEEQTQVYQTYLSASRSNLLKTGQSPNRMQILEAILRLRQICADPRLVGSEVAGEKIELLLQDIDEAPGRKVLIYSQFTAMLQLIGKALRERGREYLYLDGSTALHERAERVRKFQEEEEPSLFLLSLKAGGVGLNLTAAESVILFDPWWNDAIERQAIDRAHRIGQKKTVIAKRYLAPGSIEEKMLRLKEEKKAMLEQLLDQEAASWTEEDLLHLLS